MLLVTIFCNINGYTESEVDLSKKTMPVKVVDQPVSNNTKSNFEHKVDSLRQIIPTVKGEQKLSFKELSQKMSFKKLSQDVWDWQNSEKFIRIDSATWINNFNKPTKLGTYGHDFKYAERVDKTIYYYKIFDFKDNLLNLIILQYVSHDKSCMYLVQFDKQGNRKKTLLLAYIEKGPEWVEEIYSSNQGNKITTYGYYEDDDKVKRDTVVTLW